MISCSDALYQLRQALQALYDTREAAAIADQYLTFLTGKDKLNRIVNRDARLTETEYSRWLHDKDRLIDGTPLQYISGVTWFMGQEFAVNKHVLIPRPETEELVAWIIADDTNKKSISIIDIGTGTGCIGISLKLALPAATITCCDISPDALAVAESNAKKLHADINLLQTDFLDGTQWPTMASYDIIVSNPPYIPELEKANMHTNVKDHEPEIALFVPDNDPLLFYKAIASFGKKYLKEHGVTYCELHTAHALQTSDMFRDEEYKTVLVKDDMHGNPRMLKATL